MDDARVSTIVNCGDCGINGSRRHRRVIWLKMAGLEVEIIAKWLVEKLMDHKEKKGVENVETFVAFF